MPQRFAVYITLGTMKEAEVRIALAIAFGAIAPFIWVSSLGVWALYVSASAMKLVWAVLSIKGPVVFVVLDVLHSVLVAIAFALVLRVIAKREWQRASAVFGFSFLASFYGVAFLKTSEPTEMSSLLVLSFVGVAVLLLGVAVFSAAFAKLPRRAGA
jgi:hypothetical protein